MPRALIDWNSVDTSDWGSRPDSEIAERLGVKKSVIEYWRKKFGIASYRSTILAERGEKAEQGLYWCGGCESYKPASEFGDDPKQKYGKRAECYECRRAWRAQRAAEINAQKRRSYEANKEVVLARNLRWREGNRERLSEYMRVRHASLKAKFVELAGGACQRCGYDEFVSGLEYHHVDRLKKDSAPVKAIASGDFDRAFAELDKCVMLCRNCHQSFHAGAWSGEFEKRRELGWTLKGSG